jgi:periplasmic protein TonB
MGRQTRALRPSPELEIIEMSDLDLPRHISRPVWVLAAVGAIAIHVGCVALAYGYMQPDDDDVDLGAPAIEIGVELMAPHAEPTDLPPGPDVDASAASPAMVEQKAVVEQTELPKAVPTETDDPDRLVTPNDTNKPKEDDPKVAVQQTSPSIESIAVEATATPSIESAPEAPRSVAPVQGTGRSARRERATWQKELAVHLDKNKRYPTDRAAKAAEVVVGFVLDRTGHVLSTHVIKGSGDASFDAAALAMLRRADPVPPPPPLVADEGLTFTLPVIFQVKKEK